MAARVTVTGDRQVIQRMRRLAAAPQGKVLDAIAADALSPMALEVASRAPITALKTGVTIGKPPRRRSFGRRSTEMWLAFRRGLAMRVAHLVEFGTQPHSMAKGASVRKGLLQDVPPFSPGTPPRPFMRPAYENTKHEVVQRAANAMWRLILQNIGGK